MIRCGRRNRSPQPHQPGREHRLPVYDQAAHPDGRRRIGQQPHAGDGDHHPRHVAQDAERQRGDQVLRQDQLPVRRVIEGPPGEGRHDDHGCQPEQSHDGHAPSPRRACEIRRRQAEVIIGRGLERDDDPLPLRPGTGQRPREHEQQQRRDTPHDQGHERGRRVAEHQRAHRPAQRVLDARRRGQDQDGRGEQQDAAARQEAGEAEGPRDGSEQRHHDGARDDRAPWETHPRPARHRGRGVGRRRHGLMDGVGEPVSSPRRSSATWTLSISSP